MTCYHIGDKSMLSANGKFLIYTPPSSNLRDRVRVVGSAVVKIAQTIKMEIEVARRTKLLSVYVYYRHDHDDDEIPVYCDWGKDWSEDDVCHAIKSVMFALSFHPKHPSLRAVRKELCTFS